MKSWFFFLLALLFLGGGILMATITEACFASEIEMKIPYDQFVVKEGALDSRN